MVMTLPLKYSTPFVTPPVVVAVPPFAIASVPLKFESERQVPEIA